jgi:hypothetical protein
MEMQGPVGAASHRKSTQETMVALLFPETS